jgi:hypothetical protein
MYYICIIYTYQNNYNYFLVTIKYIYDVILATLASIKVRKPIISAFPEHSLLVDGCLCLQDTSTKLFGVLFSFVGFT